MSDERDTLRITVRGLWLGPGGDLRVTITDTPPRPPQTQPRIDAAWTALKTQNPRLFDGLILSLLSATPQSGELSCIRETYKRLAVAATLGLDVRLLGVTGIITGHDADGDECVLLGRRGRETRMYPGMWECAPSGGVTPPPPGVAHIGTKEIIRCLIDEGAEELGINLAEAVIRPVALIRDDVAQSEDIALKVDILERIDPRNVPCRAEGPHKGWEYLDAAWTLVSQLPEFVAAHESAISPPTRGLFKWLGWI